MTGAVLLLVIAAGAADAGGPFQREHATRALLLGGSGAGHLNTGASLGSPWATATLHAGLRSGWTPLVEVQAAKWRRFQPAVGVGRRWVDRRWVISGESVVGWTLQGDPLPFRGPAAELRLKGGRTVGRFVPYTHLGVRGSRTVDRVEDTTGTVLREAARWETTFTGALGTGFMLTDRLGLDVGLDLPWVDVPAPSIPGVHLGVHGGFGRAP